MQFTQFNFSSATDGGRTRTRIPTCLLAAALLAGAGAASAAEYGTVVSSTPVVTQVPVQQQQCYDEQQSVAPRSSGGGAVVGAVIGGLLGNSMGRGNGRAAATGVGVVAGAVIGDKVETRGRSDEVAVVRRCQNVSGYEQRVTAYDVVYDYAGRRYTTRWSQPVQPGSRIELDVNVAPAGMAPAAPVSRAYPVSTPAVGYDEDSSTTVYYTEPARPVYYAPPPPPPVVVYGQPQPHPYYRGGTNFQFRGDWRREGDGRRWHHER